VIDLRVVCCIRSTSGGENGNRREAPMAHDIALLGSFS
jgi:hypothetical protein